MADPLEDGNVVGPVIEVEVGNGEILDGMERLLRSRAAKVARHEAEDLAFVRAIEDLQGRRQVRRERLEASLAWIDSNIALLMERAREATGARSWSLPHGRVGFRKTPAGYVVEDEAAAIAYLEELQGSGMLEKIRERHPKIEPPLLRKVHLMKRGLFALIQAVGELPPGVAEVAAAEKISIQPIVANEADLLVEEEEEGAA